MNKEDLSTKELFKLITDKLIIDLKDNEVICPKCKGLKLVYDENIKNNKAYGYVMQCTNCNNGKMYQCPYCGKISKYNSCNCEKALQQRTLKNKIAQKKHNDELFKSAKKIDFYDYQGYFLINDNVIDHDEVYDWLYDKIQTDKELPTFIWGTYPQPVFDVNLCELIEGLCVDGYENMYQYLDVKTNDDIAKAQEHIKKWQKEQGDSLNCYWEDTNIAVTLDKIIDKIKEDIKSEEE